MTEREKPAVEKRAAERRSVNLRCDVRVESAVWQKDLLSDLTTEGFCIDRTSMCRVGARVWIKIGELGQLPAEIKWVEGSHAGCHFEKPLADYVFEHILRVAEQP